MNELTIHEELYTIVSQGDLSNELDERLKSLSDVDIVLQHFYRQDSQRINLLMIAALNGYENIVRVTNCSEFT